MADKYRDFATLAQHERPGVDFRIVVRQTDSPVALIAPHAGAIEPGTGEIADAIAGESRSYYAFEGMKPEGNGDLHITSTRFDEPMGQALVARSRVVIAIHGEHGGGEGVFVGGRDTVLGGRIGAALQAAGFVVGKHTDPTLQGIDAANICNRGTSGAGVQLEMSRGVRATLFKALTRAGRTQPTDRLAIFARAVQSVL